MPSLTSSVERVSTGIPGFDKLVEGGFVKGSTYLIAGQAGSGKSIFCMQYILEGLKRGETCVYLSLEQKIEEFLQDMSGFEWGAAMRKYYDEGKFVVISAEPTSIKDLQDISLAYISRVGATRFVLDSLTVAALGWKTSSMDAGKVRSEVFGYMRTIENTGATALFICEIPEGDAKKISMFGFEEFIVDGVVVLRYMTLGQAGNRTIEVRKMRRTRIDESIHTLEFSPKGIQVSD
jgi:KaiC/GvpD/RAD55 family RecA-like ATPase